MMPAGHRSRLDHRCLAWSSSSHGLVFTRLHRRPRNLHSVAGFSQLTYSTRSTTCAAISRPGKWPKARPIKLERIDFGRVARTLTGGDEMNSLSQCRKYALALGLVTAF